MHETAPSAASSADKKLAITGGLLALALGSGLSATPAEAKLITTPLNINAGMGESYTFGPVGDEFTINNLGFVDFGVPADDCGCDDILLPVITLTGNTTALSKNFVAVKAGTGPIISIAFPGLPAIDLLDFFGPGDHIGDYITDLGDGFQTSGQDIFFEPTSDVIYGLKSVGLDDPFGFLQFDIVSDGGDGEFLHLDKFVFEDVPGADAVVVPEPGTLSLFAVGGAALLAARRRKKQPKAG